jgi:glycosyltransferase involved in cell wall biosynthesis
MSRRLLIVVNADWFFLSHRLPLALAARDMGFEVHVAVGVTDRLKEIQSYGLQVHPLALDRGGARPWAEMGTLLGLIGIFRRVRPDVVHLVTIKPVLYGGFAARLTRGPAVVAAISGLGHVFVARGAKAAMRRWLIGFAYRAAFTHRRLAVIFQNEEDRTVLTQLAGIPGKRTTLIRGSGVDLSAYKATTLPDGVPCVMMACRLLADKGVWEFVEAARLLRSSGVTARFCLIGSPDLGNPASLNFSDLDAIKRGGDVEIWGHRDDMSHVLRQSSIFVLPSFYGEGLSKVLIEAAASGRAIVTTDMPGCRDAVIEGVTGLLVPPRSAGALATAIGTLLADREKCIAMGLQGRLLAEKEFDLDSVIKRHMEIYVGMVVEGT